MCVCRARAVRVPCVCICSACACAVHVPCVCRACAVRVHMRRTHVHMDTMHVRCLCGALTASKSAEAEQKLPHCTGRPKVNLSHASTLPRSRSV